MLETGKNINRKVDRLSIASGSSTQAWLSSTALHQHLLINLVSRWRTVMPKWKNGRLKILVELVRKIECLTLYPLPREDMNILKNGGLNLLNTANKLTVAWAAQKLYSNCLSICTGKGKTNTGWKANSYNTWFVHQMSRLTSKPSDCWMKRCRNTTRLLRLFKCVLSAVKTQSAALHLRVKWHLSF